MMQLVCVLRPDPCFADWKISDWDLVHLSQLSSERNASSELSHIGDYYINKLLHARLPVSN